MNPRQRQQKLFSNLISHKEQNSRTCNYKNNPLIANKENSSREGNLDRNQEEQHIRYFFR